MKNTPTIVVFCESSSRSMISDHPSAVIAVKTASTAEPMLSNDWLPCSGFP